MGVSRFEDLIAWRRGVSLAVSVFDLTQSSSRRYDRLVDQMVSSAVSIPSNVAEGFERDAMKDFCRFLGIAKGSGGELLTQLHIAGRVGCIAPDDAERAIEDAREVSRLIGSLRHAIERRVLPRARR